MKCTVKISYRDKHTKEIHKAGEVVEVTEERFEEINKEKKFLAKKRNTKADKAEGAEVAE